MQYLSNQNDVEVFPMDDLGNRVGDVTQRDGVHNYASASPNLTNRYTAIDSNSLTYDAAGNLTQDKNGYTYHYDYENRIVAIKKTNDTVTVAQYAYDALGRRIWKYDPIAAQNAYYYYNDQWQILCEYTAEATCRQWLTYGNYIDEVLGTNTSTTSLLLMRYYAHDHLYSPVALMVSTGYTVYERYEYDAYGKVTISGRGADGVWYTADDVTLAASAYNNLFTFTGRQLDVLDSGSLHHMHYRHRDYSPTMGRFFQQDPLGLSIHEKLRNNIFEPRVQYRDGLNVYQYVGCNSIIKKDPYGLDSPGCDVPGGDWGNHCWRRCCAKHDECYDRGEDPSKPYTKPCTAGSWLNPCANENCKKCNDDVAKCFATHLICDWSDTDRDYYGPCSDGSGKGYGGSKNPDGTVNCAGKGVPGGGTGPHIP